MIGKIGKSYPSPYAGGYHNAASGSTGTLSNWQARRLSWFEEGFERETIAERANELSINNAHAASLVDSMAINTVGSGLWPQAKPNWKRLGITEEQATEVAEQAEFAFETWNLEADASADPVAGGSDFYGIQFQNIYSMLVNGEFVNIPVFLDEPGRTFGLALQTIDPIRLRTPFALRLTPNIRDGIRLGDNGRPCGYFLADPDDGRLFGSLDLRHYRELPPSIGSRPTLLHRFHKKRPEDVRGMSILAPAMKFFRDMNDYLDFELVGAIVAASFPVWIGKQQGVDMSGLGIPGRTPDDAKARYQEVTPGQILYGEAGEEPKILSNTRPNDSFAPFIETILRAVGAAAGMPYEVISKDFSKTNYSSARAALEEAWRVFGMYQEWMIDHFCRIIWEMVFEEAWLRGMIKLPQGSPDFYTAKREWTQAGWIVPSRTNIDPVKEIVAAVMAKNNNILTDADIAARNGKDWEAQYHQRSREITKQKELGLPDGSAKKETVSKAPPTEQP
jgi:lambda family phage portal protein